MELNREPIYFTIETLNRCIHPGVDFTRPCRYTYEEAQALWLGKVDVAQIETNHQTVRMNIEENPVDKKRKKENEEIFPSS